MNVVPLNATTSDATSRIAELSTHQASTKFSAAALRNASPEVQAKQVAQQFEAILVRQLLAPTMSSMLSSEGGAAANVYGDLMTDTFAQQLTAGSGMGLSRVLARQLTTHSSLSAKSATASTTTPPQS